VLIAITGLSAGILQPRRDEPKLSAIFQCSEAPRDPVDDCWRSRGPIHGSDRGSANGVNATVD
jgi:hypothetical protein